jgi:hypothetical protein
VCVCHIEFEQRNGRVEVSSKSMDENYCQSRVGRQRATVVEGECKLAEVGLATRTAKRRARSKQIDAGEKNC